METAKSSYQAMKKYILERIISTKKDGNLKGNEIEDCIEKIKKVIGAMGFDFFVDSILQLDDPYCEPNEKEWKNIKRELEKHFNVYMDIGTVIQGEKQQKRDLTWWTHGTKGECNDFFSRRYEQYISKELPPEVVIKMGYDTDEIINNIGNPSDESFNTYGMVIGHVQSGKTMNYSSVICKAADAGYKFIVVITGTLNILRNQTQKRLMENFVGADDGNNMTGVGEISGVADAIRPIVLTTSADDFDGKFSKKVHFDFANFAGPVLMVIKKNVKTLKNVNGWIKTMKKNADISKHSILVIDDESDYASINTSGDDNDPTTINKGIRKILSCFDKSSYVAYTATPYANILIDHANGDDLFPRDFIYALKAPSDYHGPEKIFKDYERKYLKFINEEELRECLPEKHKSTFQLEELPEDLYEAVRFFYLNVAVRRLRHQDDKHNSMLVHISRFTNVHEQIMVKIDEYCNELSEEIRVFIKEESPEKQSICIKQMKECFEKEYKNLGFKWSEIKEALFQTCRKIQVCGEFNGSRRRIEYPENATANIIAVGGTSLSRGFTLEGLSISYFSRNTVFYDTLMQMGRWFGYRKNYEDICRIFMPETTAEYFEHIYDSTVELIEKIEHMREVKQTPEQFGLYIRKDPENALQVTARNKQKNASDLIFSLDFSGKLKETLVINNNEKSIEENKDLIKNLICYLNENHRKEKISNNFLWRGVSKEEVTDFVRNFRVSADLSNSGISGLSCNFIADYIESYETDWDVAVYSGSGEQVENFPEVIYTQQRTVKFNHDSIKLHKNRKIASEKAEFISLSGEEKTGKSKDACKYLKKPLLMLHIFQPKSGSEGYTEESPKYLAAYGVNFPLNSGSKEKPYSVKANSVYMKNLKELMKDEEGGDDDE